MAEPQEQLHFLDYWRIIQSRKEIVVAVFLLIVLTGFLVTYAMPRVYMASAVIQVKEETPDVRPFENPTLIPLQPSPIFLRTQFEILQSRSVIEEVVRRLNLDEKLGRALGYLETLGDKSFDYTVKLVSRSMKVQQYRETNLIEVRMFLAEPKETVTREVAEVANMVVEVFRTRNMARSREVQDRAMAAFLQSLEDQRAKVAQAEQNVEAIRTKYSLTLTSPYEGSGTPMEKLTLERLEMLRVDLSLELEDKRARYEKVRNAKAEELLDILPYLANDQALAMLVADRRKAEVRLSEMTRAGLGSKHPDVQAVLASVAEVQVKIDEAIKGALRGMEADFDATKAKADRIEQQLGQLRRRDIEAEAKGYHEYDKAIEELAYAKKIREGLEIRYLQERIAQSIPRTTVEVMDPAKPPDPRNPVSPNYILNAILSVLVGLMAGFGLAFFVEYMDTSVKTIDDIERHLQLPILGVIPQKVRPLIEEGADAAHAEAYRVLRTNIQFAKKFSGGHTLCVTSGSVGEGKSLTLFNLAYICAQLGDRVLIVDSDLHRPRQHKILGVSNRLGLANILAGESTFDSCLVKTKMDGLHFLPSGKMASGIHGLFDNKRLTALIAELRDRYTFLLFDAPPMIGVSDTSLLVREMDGVMLVIQHRKYPRSVSSRARAMIDNLGANLIGVVLNNINISRDYSYYYYHQHYYYYPRHGRDEEKKGGKPA